MNERYIEPTAATRSKLAAATAAFVVFGWAYGVWISPRLQWVASLPTCDSLPWVRLELIAGILICWCISFWALRLGGEILRAGQYPLPRAWVWHRTRVRTGFYAKFVAYFSLFTSAVFAIGPMLVVAWQELYVVFCYPKSCGCG